jgi:hypothetical protein
MIMALRKKHLLVLVILVLSVVIYFKGLNPVLPLNEDSAIYINMAQSLSQGRGSICTAGPVATPVNYYPSFYPRLLSGFIYYFPGNYLVLKMFGIFLTLVFLLSLVYFYPKLFCDKSEVLLLAMVGFSTQICMYSRAILTEMSYTLFSVASIYFLSRYHREKGAFNRYFFVSALTLVFVCYTRLVGMGLILSVLIFFILKKDLKKASASLLFFLVLAPWVAGNVIFGRSAYTREFVSRTGGAWDFIHRWIYNLLATIGKELPDLFFYPWLNRIDPRSIIFIFKFAFGGVLAALLVWGFIRKLKKEGLQLWDTYVVVYFFMFYLSWTHHGARYLVPILVFLMYYLILAIRSVAPKRAMFFLLSGSFIISGITGDLWLDHKDIYQPYSPVEASFVRSGDWLKDHASKNSIIVSRRPNWMYMYTSGLKGLKFLRTPDVAAQHKYIMAIKADYLVIDQNKIYRDDARQYLEPLVRAYPDMFELAHVTDITPQTYVYRVKRAQ